MKILKKLSLKIKNRESFSTLILVLVIVFSCLILVKISAQEKNINNKSINNISNTKDSKLKLELVEKLNAQIEEQDHLLTIVEKKIEQNKKNKDINGALDQIIINLIKVEEEATKKQVISLINVNLIDEIAKKIETFKKVLK